MASGIHIYHRHPTFPRCFSSPCHFEPILERIQQCIQAPVIENEALLDSYAQLPQLFWKPNLFPPPDSPAAKSLLKAAVDADCIEVAQHLITLGTLFDVNVLEETIRRDQMDLALLLIEKQPALLNEKNSQGKSPLAIAVESACFDTAKALAAQGALLLDANDLFFFELFEQRHFAPLCFLFEMALCGDLSPLKMEALWVAACAQDHEDLASRLLKLGLAPQTPSLIHAAIYFERKNLIRMLLAQGAMLDAPAYHECIRGDMALWLVQVCGVDPFLENGEGVVLCQDKSLVRKDIAAQLGYAGILKGFMLSDSDFEALKIRQQRTEGNLLRLAFLLGHKDLALRVKASYPSSVPIWLDELRRSHSESALRGLSALYGF